MPEPFMGEIRLMAFTTVPKGWAQCNGQLLPINQNAALYSLLGVAYGGNGSSNFALPDLRDRVPIHVGGGLVPGNNGGATMVALTLAQIPTHTHGVNVSSATGGGTSTPTRNVIGGAANVYHAPTTLTAMNNQTIASTGSGAAHTNVQPFLTLNFCIALLGLFPSRP